LFLPIGGPPLPTFSELFISVTVLEPTIGSGGTIDGPTGGAIAAAGSYSDGLFGLNGKLDAASCVPASLAASASDELDADEGCIESDFAGPLTVARLLRRTFDALAGGGVGRFDLDMEILVAPGYGDESAWRTRNGSVSSR
jgi:hypothetical protein